MHLTANKCINFGDIFLPPPPKGAVYSEVGFIMDSFLESKILQMLVCLSQVRDWR